MESTSATHLGTERAVIALVIATFSVICVTSIGDERLAGVVHSGHNCWAVLALFWSGKVGTIPAGGREASRLPKRAWPGRRERWTAPMQHVHTLLFARPESARGSPPSLSLPLARPLTPIRPL